jgi:PAS domain S-box-containing protein
MLKETAAEKLKTEQRYQQLVENSLQGIVILQDFKIVYVNPAVEKILGYSVKEMLSFKPQQIIKLIHPDDRSLVWKNYKNRLDGLEIPPHYVLRGISKDKSTKYLDVYSTRIEYEGRPAIQGIILDITDQIKAKQVLQQRNLFIETILKNLPLGILVIEIDTGKTLFLNREFEEILGWKANEIPDIKSVLEKVSMNPMKKNILSGKLIKSIQDKNSEDIYLKNLIVISKTNQKKYLSTRIITLLDQNLIMVTLQDVTERNIAEIKLQNSLQEKEILLKEIHHRVKNNLQTISSLLDLHAESISDPKSLEAFKSSQSRIKSMALIHERLYKSENLSLIKTKEYLNNLTEYLESTYIAQTGIIEIKTDVQDIYLNLDIAIPCGLIINELVSNSMKHAFPKERNGEIFIQLIKHDDINLRLSVKDNGIGMQKIVNSDNSSLGLQLVDLLVKQINGTMITNNSEGTEYLITFPYNN